MLLIRNSPQLSAGTLLWLRSNTVVTQSPLWRAWKIIFEDQFESRWHDSDLRHFPLDAIKLQLDHRGNLKPWKLLNRFQSQTLSCKTEVSIYSKLVYNSSKKTVSISRNVFNFITLWFHVLCKHLEIFFNLAAIAVTGTFKRIF